jgi:cob(I)alamin adenosyltransferase
MSPKVYIKVGDEGFTFRPGGQRVPKSDPAVEAVGTIDELNAHLGLCLAGAGELAPVREAIAPVQSGLLTVGALLAAAGTQERPSVNLDETAVAGMERQIDRMTAKLPELTHFILPAGCELACRLHVARTVCRRAERRAVALAEAGAPVPPEVLRYLNRLSDLLFTAARCADQAAGQADVVWPGQQ